MSSARHRGAVGSRDSAGKVVLFVTGARVTGAPATSQLIFVTGTRDKFHVTGRVTRQEGLRSQTLSVRDVPPKAKNIARAITHPCRSLNPRIADTQWSIGRVVFGDSSARRLFPGGVLKVSITDATHCRECLRTWSVCLASRGPACLSAARAPCPRTALISMRNLSFPAWPRCAADKRAVWANPPTDAR